MTNPGWRFLGPAAVALQVCLTPVTAGDLDLATRMRAEEAIERLYHGWREGGRRSFDEALTPERIEHKVREGLLWSAVLRDRWRAPITARALERELARIARDTAFPHRLEALYAALDHDAFLIQECFVRPRLAERLLRSRLSADEALRGVGWDEWWASVQRAYDPAMENAVASPDTVLPRPRARGDGVASLGTCPADDTWDNASLDDVPLGRENPAMLWTGSELFVWGGGGPQDFGVAPDLGGLYDPLTETWRTPSRVGAPAPYEADVAVWSGTMVVVWGRNGGGRYDPLSDTWSPVTSVGAPAGRMYASVVWTGNEMIVWGGRAPNYTGFGDGGRYDPQSDTWSPMTTAGAPSARWGHDAVWTGTQMILWGGIQGFDTYLSGGGRYDPANDAWLPISATGAPTARNGPSVTWTGSEMIVWGGWPSGGWVNTGARYDPWTDRWEPTSTVNAPSARFDHSAVWTGAEMIVWDGHDQNAHTPPSGARYDPGTDAWAPLVNSGAPRRRARHGAVWTGTSMVVWGGNQGGGWDSKHTMQDGGIYDLAASSWVPTAGPPYAEPCQVVWTGAEVLVRSLFVFFGGSTPRHDRYDPLTDSWSAFSSQTTEPVSSTSPAVWTGDEMIVWGSQSANSGARYDPARDEWRATSTVDAPEARSRHSAVWTGDEMIVWGGLLPDQPQRDARGTNLAGSGGRYDPVLDMWQALPVGGTPTSRYTHSAVWSGSEMLIWGGQDEAGPLATGARYDPLDDAWQPITTVGAPSARNNHAAAWTGSEMFVAGSAASGTGGRYDPVTDVWTATSTANAVTGSGARAIPIGTEILVMPSQGSTPVVPNFRRYDVPTDAWTAISTSGAPPIGGIRWTPVWANGVLIALGTVPADGLGYFGVSGGRWFFGMNTDNDLDGPSECDGDCDDLDPSAWSAPGEVRDLRFLDRTTVAWDPPLEAGGTSLAYDTLRSTLASDFVHAAVCVESGDGTDLVAADDTTPAAGSGFFYLVRADNACHGSGTLGSGSNGDPREGVVCP